MTGHVERLDHALVVSHEPHDGIDYHGHIGLAVEADSNEVVLRLDGGQQREVFAQGELEVTVA